MNRIIIFVGLLLFNYSLKAASVDTIDIPSAAMNKIYKAAVVLPASYVRNQIAYPVMYLLHGGSGHFNDWLNKTPDRNLIQRLSDQYNLIVVMPEGETFGWYMDSPYDKTNMFETHIIKEVVPKIDGTYRTQKTNKGRVITGLSMGGHGAMYLSTRHPDLFGAAGTMSGAMDMSYSKFKVNADFQKSLKDRFEKLLGTTDETNPVYVQNSIINQSETIKKNGMPIFIDCGVDDFLIETNRQLHHRLLYNGTPHDYIERPGGHTWDYWENALPYHVLFFHNVLKKNGTAVN